ncbi:MAG: ribosome maturation factor RimM [Alphaproteobacteria bacterium]|nr:ribosome maturation factor RimM [Alphaproteobacteria bacterium]
MKRICLGKIVSAHGVKGLVKILPFGEDVSLMETLSPLYKYETGNSTIAVALKNKMGKYVLAAVEGVSERNAAEALRGTELYVDQDSLPAIEEDGAYYHGDLIGLKAVDGQGAEIGSVIAVHNFGAGDLLEIRPLQGGGDFLLPFTNANVSEISGERIVVHIPEGLL